MNPMRLHRRMLLGLAGGTALDALVPGRLWAKGLNRWELERLMAQGEVRVPLDLDLPQGSYFGGIVYQMYPGRTGDKVMEVAGDPATYTRIIAKTLEARALARIGRDMQVYLRQGEGVLSFSYVVRVRQESSSLLRFWVDLSQPHDLNDGWGFLRCKRWVPPTFKFPNVSRNPDVPLMVLTWAVLLRLDAGTLLSRYTEDIRRGVMQTPRQLLHFMGMWLPGDP